ncbi:serine hydrolase domain-containing protein [Actinoplanes sp. NBRC 101535]|uniref:serine hydrolase domain-containing protein n=1 Tax=Actinoplanes sp. NBRC 101535 TaxID=3032196 RepID=UPI0025566A42|nr:serine hydrolase domain-containing protein [Actinoplanes sp. NBRC 101535]
MSQHSGIARTCLGVLAVPAVALAFALPPLPAAAPAVAVGPARAAAVGAAIETRLEAGRVPAAAYAVVIDATVIVGAHGDGVTASTPFLLGSVSKSFTALSVLQLAERGQVRLDDPVTRYLPWFRTADPVSVPTVRQLLDQTSGLPTAAGVAGLRDTDRTLEQRVRAIAGVTPTAAPGETFQYCNLNYATLGLLVQEVSGMSYADYLRVNVLEPLDMTGTYTSVGQARAAGLERATVPWFGVQVRREATAFAGALPDGYLVSTAEDMGHYLQMQIDGGTYRGRSILSADLVALMRQTATATPQDAAAPGTDGYALGLATGTVGGTALVAHQGDVTGFHSDLALLPDRDQGLVVLTAQNAFLLENDAAYRAGLGVLAGAETPEFGFWDGYLGRYLIADGAAAVVALLMALRGVRLARGAARGCRNRSVTRAVAGLAAAIAGSAGLYAGIAVGGGALVQGYPLDPGLVLSSAPELALIAGAVVAYPVLSSVLTSIGALRRGRRTSPPRCPAHTAVRGAAGSVPAYSAATSALIRSS